MAVALLRLTLVMAATLLVPQSPVVRDDVDTIELNHVYDVWGNHTLSQLIFWKHYGISTRTHVVAWRLWKPGYPMPVHDVPQGGYALLFIDGQTLRLLRSQRYRETWTQYAPEIADRLLLPQNRRVGLTRRELDRHERPASQLSPSQGAP